MFWKYLANKIRKTCYFKYDVDNFANVATFCTCLGYELYSFLPSFNALTGSDTASHSYNIGKVKVFNMLMKNVEPASLLTELSIAEPLTTEKWYSLKKFVEILLRNRKTEDSYFQTWCRSDEHLLRKSP